MIPAALRSLPQPIQPTLELLAAFDQCFLVGFANLDRSHWRTLEALQRILSDTPLQQPFSQACIAIQRNEFLEQHFTAVATVRAALQGALFDALRHQVQESLGRVAVATPATPSPSTNLPISRQTLLESTVHWLMEIALSGLARLEASSLLPFLTTLEKIQQDPQLIHQAALLTGFWNELIRSVPISDSTTLPLYRWVDLWSRSLLSTLSGTVPTGDYLNATQCISGTLALLGLDLHQHANLVSFTLYGLLTVNQQPQVAKISLSAYKVDVIRDDELWLLFPQAVTLLEAFTQNKMLRLTNISLLPSGDLLLPEGDLLWTGNGAIGSNYSLMQQAAQYFAIDAVEAAHPAPVQPIDRHPIQLAEPIFLEGYRVEQAAGLTTLQWGETSVPVALERLSPSSEVTPEAIAHSTQLFGLLRFDAGRWAVQPLALTVKGKLVFTGQKAAKILKSPPKNSTVSILQERASRLLRKG